jgi:hypothetical protein
MPRVQNWSPEQIWFRLTTEDLISSQLTSACARNIIRGNIILAKPLAAAEGNSARVDAWRKAALKSAPSALQPIGTRAPPRLLEVVHPLCAQHLSSVAHKKKGVKCALHAAAPYRLSTSLHCMPEQPATRSRHTRYKIQEINTPARLFHEENIHTTLRHNQFSKQKEQVQVYR